MSGRILVVEDQDDNKRIMRDLLTSAGYAVLEASSGVEAIEVAQRERPDLILMDIQLPGMDGHEATRRLKGDPDMMHIPIVAVTSYAFDGDRQEAMEAGSDAYFAKPVSPREILAKVESLVPADTA